VNRESKQATRLLIRGVESPVRLEGLLLCGSLSKGDCVATMPSGQQSTVMNLQHQGTAIESAEAEANLAVELAYAVKASPGDILSGADLLPEYADQFEAALVWLGEDELLPGRNYQFQSNGGSTEALVSKLKYRLEPGTDKQIAANTLRLNETGVGNVALTTAVLFDPVLSCSALGKFQLLDRESSKVVAEGEIRHGLRRASNIHWQATDVDKASRAAIKNQVPRLIWMTGLSGSGKSTIANLLEKKLLSRRLHSYLVDGDNVRHGLNKDLGFTAADRVENIRRVAETSRLMLDADLIVITSFISPFRAEREMARALFDDGEFIEIFVDTPLAVCEQRDPKGLYAKARAGDIKNFTGIDSPYEPPERPELVIDTVRISVEEAADRIIDYLDAQG